MINEGGAVTGGGYGIQDIPPLALLARRSPASLLRAGAVAVLVVVSALQSAQVPAFGREIMASRDNPDSAAAAGIDPAAIRLVVLVIAASLAADGGLAAGLLLPHRQHRPGQPRMDLRLVLHGAGGRARQHDRRRARYCAAGAVPELLGFAAADTILWIGVLMVAVTLFAPRGLGGLLDDLRRKASAGCGMWAAVSTRSSAFADVAKPFGGVRRRAGRLIAVEHGEICGLIGPNGAGNPPCSA